ncbi:threonine-phosphate decarboxylase CobD [Halopseudomonas salegens]|uniref:threonine-phosphate decarboxylase n=1 Tax=Halopseudomonas salegens TaxID=1434072 RepID=A0A1H2HQR0_9GAMM|nr:threonine-phosphate decarboxylase CobD [Halopseudomonas salegens]SDU34223.1 L-threonine O-3-phosphate decarboxylase [Halopseudomonas salegens]
MLEHGGRLRQAAQQYGIKLAAWLDLSTGLAPWGWPLPVLPASCWRQLPEPDDGLIVAAQDYYQATSLLPVAGSQAAIQALPWLRPACRVLILGPCYAEHAQAWARAGHQVQVWNELTESQPPLDTCDVLVLVNPNNPTGRLLAPDTLLAWHAELAARGGWLLVDEAFADLQPEFSLARYSDRPGLIVLRSLGKFFALAGARVGFVLAESALLAQLEEQLGPWAVNGPARLVAQQVLVDRATQQAWRLRLQRDGRRLQQLLSEQGLTSGGGCALFQWVPHPAAASLHQQLAGQGILTRLFDQPAAVRIGLPGNKAGWDRLQQALQALALPPADVTVENVL